MLQLRRGNVTSANPDPTRDAAVGHFTVETIIKWSKLCVLKSRDKAACKEDDVVAANVVLCLSCEDEDFYFLKAYSSTLL